MILFVKTLIHMLLEILKAIRATITDRPKILVLLPARETDTMNLERVN